MIQSPAVFENALEAMLLADDQGRLKEANPAALRLTGYSREELLHLIVFDLAPRPEPEKGLGLWQEFLAQGRREGRYHLRRKDGAVLLVEYRAVASVEPGLHLVAMREASEGRAVAADQNGAQEALRRSEAELSAIYQNAPSVMILVDEDRRVVKANRAAFQVAGRDPGQDLGLRGGEFLRCVHALDDPRGCGFGPHCQSCLVRHTVLDTLTTGQPCYKVEAPVRLDLGRGPEDMFVLVSTSLLIVDHRNLILVCLEDVTGRRRAEAEAGRQARFLQTLIDALPTPIFYKDKDGLYLGCNKTYEEVFGKSRVNMKGRTVFEVYPKELADIYHETDRKMFSGQEPRQIYQSQVVSTDGTRHDVVFYKSLFSDEQGGVGGIIGSVIDVTERRRAEEALKGSEERFRLLFENAPLAYQSLDEEGRIITVNQAWLKTLGYSREQVLGKWFGNFLSPEMLPLFEEKFPCFKTTGQVSGTDFEMVKADGSTIAVSYEGRIAREPDGRFRQTHCIIKDITEQKRAQEALRRSESELLAIYQNAPSVMILVDEDRRVVKANRAAFQVAGRDPGQDLCRRAGEFLRCVHSLDDPRGCGFGPDCQTCPVRETIHATLDTGQPHYKVEATARLDLGQGPEDVFLLVSTSLLHVDRRKLILVCLEDVTESRRAEAEAGRQAQFLQTLIDALPISVFYKDKDGRYLSCNKAHEELFGKSRAERHKKTVYEVHPKELADVYFQSDQKLLSGQEMRQVYETSVVSANGLPHDVLLCKSVFRDERGSIAGIIGSVLDITGRKRAEEALKQSEERYRNLVEASPDALMVWVEEKIAYINRTGLNLLGLSKPEEALGRHFTDFWGLEQVPAVQERFKLALESGATLGMKEYRIVRADGQTRFIEATAVRTAFQGRPATLSIYRDITGRKETEESLQALVNASIGSSGQEFFDNVVVRLGQWLNCDMAMIAELDDENTASVLAMRRDGKMVLGHRYPLAGTPCEQAALKGFCHFPEGAAGLFPQNKDQAGPAASGYLGAPLRGKDGRVMGVLCAVSRGRLRLPERGREIIEVIADRAGAEIERRRAERALRAKTEELDRYFTSSLDLLCIADIDGYFRRLNPEWERVLGYSLSELEGKSFLDFVHPEDLPSTRQAVASLSGQKEVHNFVNRYRCKDGAYRWLEWRSHPAGQLIYAVARDISDKKRAEEERDRLESQLRQAQKMEAVGTLAGGIAHDFNNILAVISGYAELAQMEMAEGSVGHKLNQILKATQRAKELVQQILSFSRHSEMQKKPVAVGPLVKEVLKLLRATLPTTIEIRPRMETQEDLVLADPTQIHQVLINLCANAAHAMRERGGVLEVGLGAVDLDQSEADRYLGLSPGPHLRLSVSDTGCGMDKKTIERIFEPFFTTKGPSEGSGLGLAVVHGIVKGHQGAITVYSELGQGTTFNIYLPVLTLDQTAQPEAVAGPIPRGSGRILFVDDEADLVQVGVDILGRLGYQVTGTSSGLEASRLFQARPDDFDLIITDQTMPGLTGLELAKEALQTRPGLPIILCTGFSDQVSPEKTVAAGLRAFLLKPLNLRELAQAVAKALAKPD